MTPYEFTQCKIEIISSFAYILLWCLANGGKVPKKVYFKLLYRNLFIFIKFPQCYFYASKVIRTY